MKKQKMFIRLSILLLAVVVLFTVFTASAQDDDKPLSSESNVVNISETAGARFVFSGVRTTTQIATVVHCSNPTADNVLVTVIVFQWNNIDSYQGQLTITPGQTSTFSFMSTDFGGTFLYIEDREVTTTNNIGQGRGIIITDPADAPIYCTAQVLDGTTTIPNFVTNLSLYATDSTGVPITTFLRETFLPTVIKN